MDSLRFMAASLHELALQSNEYKITCKQWHGLDSAKFSLFTKRGCLPYDYLTSLERLDERQFPIKEALTNKLTEININRLEAIRKQRGERLRTSMGGI